MKYMYWNAYYVIANNIRDFCSLHQVKYDLQGSDTIYESKIELEET